MAEAAMAQVGLDEVRFVVAHQPWQKMDTRDVSSPAVRAEMTRALIDGHGAFSVDDREIRRGGLTYTIDTLEEVRASEGPDTEIFLILGADTAKGLDTWHRIDDVLALSTLVIVNRDSQTTEVSPLVAASQHVAITMVRVDASSTSIREAVSRGDEVVSMTLPSVVEIISSHHLYKDAV